MKTLRVELFKVVLDLPKITKVSSYSDEPVTVHIDQQGRLHSEEINVYELANKCKEWLIEGVADMMSVRDWNWTTEINDRVVEHRVESTSAVVVAAIYAPQKF